MSQDKKKFTYLRHHCFKPYWKQNMKEIPYWWIFESFDFELIDAYETFPKDD
jgi:hypothetical protein